MKRKIFPLSVVPSKMDQLPFSLRRSLVPLHKLSYLSGTVLNWCTPSGLHHYRSCRRSTIYTIHCTVVAFFLLLSCYTTIVEFLELLFFLKTQHITFDKLIPYMITFVGRPVLLGTHIYFVIYRKKLLSFFGKWNQMELNYASLDRNYSSCRKSRNTSRVCTIMMGVYLMFSASLGVGYTILVIENEKNNDLITSKAKDIDKFFVKNQLKYYMTNWVYISIDLINMFPILIVLTMSDIVPTFVFYHGSNFLQILRDRFSQLGALVYLRGRSSSISNSYYSRNKFDIEATIHDLWSHYETLNDLITKANKLFGPLLILNHGLAFFDICSATVALFYSFNDNGKTLYASVLVGFTLRLATTVILMSKVRTSSNQLYSTVTTVQLRNWAFLGPKEHLILQSFLSQLQNDRLVASPCRLYKITLSILLVMFSLVITYTIVLIQST